MKKLIKIVSEYAEIDETKLDKKMLLVKDLGLDSFALIALVTEIEQVYGVSISDADLSHFQTFEDVCGYLKKNSKNYSEEE